MRLREVGIALALIGLASAGLALGCKGDAALERGPRAAGPDYTNFAPPPLARPDAPGGAARPADAIVPAAGAFRMAAAADLAAALREFPTASCLDFLRSTDVYEAMPGAWAYFFSTTVVLVGNEATPEPVVAYYSPFLDAAVVTRWGLDARGQPAMLAATFRSGAEIESRRLTAAPALPQWLCGDEAGPVLLGQHYRAVAKAFAAEFPASPRTPWGGYATVSSAALQGAGAMATMQALTMCALSDGPNKPLCGAVRELREVVAAGDVGRLARLIPQENPFSAAQIAGFPPEFRRALAPAFALWTDRQATVLLIDSRLPRFCAVATYDVGDAVSLRGLGICDLAANVSSGASPDGRSLARP